jgi:hypothetical protein
LLAKKKRAPVKTTKAKRPAANVTPTRKQSRDLSSDEESIPQKKAKGASRKVQIVTPPKQGGPAPLIDAYCLASTLDILGLGGKCTRTNCKFKHAADKNAIDKDQFLKQIKSSTAKMLTPEKRTKAKAILNGSKSNSEVKDE